MIVGLHLILVYLHFWTWPRNIVVANFSSPRQGVLTSAFQMTHFPLDGLPGDAYRGWTEAALLFLPAAKLLVAKGSVKGVST